VRDADDGAVVARLCECAGDVAVRDFDDRGRALPRYWRQRRRPAHRTRRPGTGRFGCTRTRALERHQPPTPRQHHRPERQAYFAFNRSPSKPSTSSSRNPRRVVGDLKQVAATIAEHGLLQPLVVRRVRTRCELIAGHRQLLAIKQLGWLCLPAVVCAADDDQAFALTVVENLQQKAFGRPKKPRQWRSSSANLAGPRAR
jgi:ParB/Sulfiredoxin domain